MQKQISLDLHSSSDEASSEDDEEESDGDAAKKPANDLNFKGSDGSDEDDDEEEASSDGDDSDEDSDDGGARDSAIDTAWGRSSSQYYAGDTADLEIGQDFGEAKEEEAIAVQMQRKKRRAEAESDYMILGEAGPGEDTAGASGGTAEGTAAAAGGGPSSSFSASRLSRKGASSLSDAERRERLLHESPELAGLLTEVSLKLEELSLLGLALDEAHTHQASAVSAEGVSYLELRHHLLLSYVMNVNMYLLLKAEEAEQANAASQDFAGLPLAQTSVTSVREHPVVDQLLKLQRALDKLKPLQKKGKKAVALLVQRAAEEALGDEEEGSQEGEEDEDEDADSDDISEEGDEESEDEGLEGNRKKAKKGKASKAAADKASTEAKVSFVDDDERRFNRRAAEASSQAEQGGSAALGKKAAKQLAKQRKALLGSDVGDIDDAPALPASSSSSSSSEKKKSGKSTAAARLQASVHSMAQKQKSAREQAQFGDKGGDVDVPVSAERTQRAQKSVVGSAELTDTFFGGPGEADDDGEDAGLDAELDADDAELKAQDSDDFGEDDVSDDVSGGGGKEEGVGGEEEAEFQKFYSEMAAAGQARTAKRKERYVVEPRVGNGVQPDVAPGAKRAASYQIIKNRGLVASKSKINRNPRVKKKEQFRKATIRRKGQVRDIRDAGEGQHYGGEATGIKVGVTRSRKINN